MYDFSCSIFLHYVVFSISNQNVNYSYTIQTIQIVTSVVTYIQYLVFEHFSKTKYIRYSVYFDYLWQHCWMYSSHASCSELVSSSSMRLSESIIRWILTNDEWHLGIIWTWDIRSTLITASKIYSYLNVSGF